MNTKSQATKLQSFLSQYTNMWNCEIMNEYPKSLEFYPSEWIDLLLPLTESQLYDIDCKKIPEAIAGSSLARFINTLIELSALESVPQRLEYNLEDWAYNGVKKKKRHEIQKITSALRELQKSTPFESVVDIGGGVGHLARILAHYHSIACVSLDRDSEFQNIGKHRASKYRKIDGSREVRFVNLDFTQTHSPELLKSIFTENSLTLGLHTCGALANSVMKLSQDFQTVGLLSFGCCYHRLDPKKDYPLSAFYKEHTPLELNLYALSLATRSHSAMTYSDYQTKERVKYYRYALHLFLRKHFKSDYFTEVGECPIKMYWGEFADYIKIKLSELNLTHQFTEEDFNQFYRDEKTQKELRVMWICNLIRWQLGRALEVYLLLDRSLSLSEQGMEVKIEQYFSEELSPRNIGILAIRKN